MKKFTINFKKATPIPSGYKQFTKEVQGRKRTFIQCTNSIDSSKGSYPCSFIKRKDTIPKDIPIEDALNHKCFNQDIDRFFNFTARCQEFGQSREKETTPLVSSLANFASRHCISLAIGPYMKDLLSKAVAL